VRDRDVRDAGGRVQLFAAGRLGVVPGGLHPRDLRVRADIRQLHGARGPGAGTGRPAPAVAAPPPAAGPGLPAGAAGRAARTGRVGLLVRARLSEREGLRLPAAP